MATDRLSGIDYFGTGQTNGAKSSSKGQEKEDDDGEECEVGSESGDSGTRGKRKQKDVGRDVRTKKTKSNQVEEIGNVCGCLLHL